MFTIFELSLEKKELLDELFWNEKDEDLLNKLESINSKIERKLSYCTDLLAEARAIVAIRKSALDEAKKRLEMHLKQAERAEQRLVNFIQDSMERSGIKKVNGDIINITFVETKTIEFNDNFDYNELPIDLFKPQLSLKDRVMMREAKVWAKNHGLKGVFEGIKTSIRES